MANCSGGITMETKELKDKKLKKLVQLAPNKSISDIFREALQTAQSEGHFREIAKNKVEQMQEEINLIMSYLNDANFGKM